MSFEFRTVYAYWWDGKFSDIAVGVFPTPPEPPDDREGFRWLVLSRGSTPGHSALGEVVEKEKGALEIHSDVGVFRFVPLTLELWNELAAEGSVVSKPGLFSDYNMLYNTIVESVLQDWWVEAHEAYLKHAGKA